MATQSQPAMQDKYLKHDLAAVLLLTLVATAFFSPLLFGGKTLYGRDITVLAWPMKYFLFKSYHAGQFPLWNPELNSGMPFLASFLGALYPLNLVFLLDSFSTAFNLFYFLHYLLLAVSVYGLTRHWKLSIGAALCASATALLSGFFLSLHASVSLFYSAVWFPPVFLFYQRFLNDGKTWSFLAAVICLACEILGGCPEFCALTVLMMVVWTLHEAPQGGVQATWRRLALLGAVVLMALATTAPQLLPTYALISQSGRSEGMSFEAHARWSIAPGDLSTLLVPADHSGFMAAVPAPSLSLFQSLYMGIFAIYFLCAGVLFVRNREILFWVLVFLFGIFFALGRHNPLYRLLFDYFPLLSYFRYPEKFYFLCAFSQVFLAGWGVDELAKSLSARDSRSPLFFYLALALAVILVCAVFILPGRGAGISAVLLVVFLSASYRVYLGKLNATVLRAIVLALMLLDLTLKDHMLIPMIEKSFYEVAPPVASMINEDPETFRVFVGNFTAGHAAPQDLFSRQLKIKEVVYPALGTIYGMNYVDGLRGWGMETRDQWWWASIFDRSGLDKKIRMLERGNVKYWIDANIGNGVQEGFSPLDSDRVKTLPKELPRAFIVPKARWGEPLKLLNIYYDESFDPLAEVLVSEPEFAQNQASVEFSASVERMQREPNRVTMETRQNTTGFLVLLDAWFPGWSVKVDGKPEQMIRANHFYRAVRLGPGLHHVAFDYQPVGFQPGLCIAGATWAILAVGIYFYRLKIRMES